MKTLYTIKEADFIVVDGQIDSVATKLYKIKDMPEEEKPREKMLMHGPDTLSLAELLAVILGTGSIKEDVLSMANRIIKEYGEKSLISKHDPKMLALELGIPLGKSMQWAGDFLKRKVAQQLFVLQLKSMSMSGICGIYPKSIYAVSTSMLTTESFMKR